jgi:hypothetical protein
MVTGSRRQSLPSELLVRKSQTNQKTPACLRKLEAILVDRDQAGRENEHSEIVDRFWSMRPHRLAQAQAEVEKGRMEI